jgi:hypothetical protein
MIWNLAQTMSLIKAAQHKYTHRKLVGRDPKTGRPRYRYYYARHHGGGITGAAFEAGSAFRLTFKGRTGHFHVESVDGDMVTVRHDGRKGSKPIEMSRDELRTLLERQHSRLETASREKAQKKRKRAAKKRKSTKRQAPAKRAQLSVADQVEEHRGQLLDQAKALKERIEGLDKKKDKAEIARLRDEAGALSGAALLAQRAQRDGVENAGPMIQKQLEQTQRMIDRSDNAEHTARLTRDLEQKRKLLDIIEGKTQVEPERPKREKAQQGADNFETMPEEPRNLKTARRELKEKEEILEGSKRAGTSADKLAKIESEIADKRSKVEVLEENHLSGVFADKLRSSAESARGKRLIDALAEAHEKREGVEGAERALINFYKETALKRKGSPERLKDREFKDLRNIKNRWLESDEDTLYDSLKEQETEARQIYFEHVSSGDSSPYTQAQVDAAVKRQTERGARAEALKFAYTEGMLRTAQELKAQDETTQQAPQRSQTAPKTPEALPNEPASMEGARESIENLSARLEQKRKDGASRDTVATLENLLDRAHREYKRELKKYRAREAK